MRLGHGSIDLEGWALVLYRRQSFARRLAGARLTFTVEGPKLAHASIGDFFGFSWAWGPVR